MSLDDFAVLERIPGGICSNLLRAVRLLDGRHAVLKCYEINTTPPGIFGNAPSECSEPYLKEAHFLQRIQNVPGCVKILDYFHDKSHDQYVIVLEDLHSLGFECLNVALASNDKFLTESNVSWILRETINTLQQIHEFNILHCDIKPDNIFIHRQEKRIKLLDFNIATEIVPKMLEVPRAKSIRCTPDYAPPEVLIQQRPWTTAGEVWSLGVTAFVLLCKKFPFRDPFMSYRAQPDYPQDSNFRVERDINPRSHYTNGVVDKLKAPPIRLSLRAREFLMCCLHKIPKCRPSLQSLSMHPFLSAESSMCPSFITNSLSFDNIVGISTKFS
ncbi:unnamed protein product [Rodentolepis nana]|uniref:Protein kinase domain-containing protein n=1 Tax=Rodentolepis nana TaxID=102285 RepID=A0A0R3TLG3_RODNA|nr:unnamed protein product [Rodentolepis nana]